MPCTSESARHQIQQCMSRSCVTCTWSEQLLHPLSFLFHPFQYEQLSHLTEKKPQLSQPMAGSAHQQPGRLV